MNDIERDLEEVGKRIWPDPAAERERVVSRRGRRWVLRRFAGPMGAIVGTGLAFALVGGAAAATILVAHQYLGLLSPSATTHQVGQAGQANPGGGQPAGQPGTSAAGASGQSGGSSGGGGPGVSSGSTLPGSSQVTPEESGQVPTSLPATFPPTPNPTSQPPLPGATLTLTQNSQGYFYVRRGTTINVDLSGSSPGWSVPSSNPDQIVHFVSGSRSSNGNATATFVAQASGDATIQATHGLQCPPVCGPPSYLWKVQITVLP